MKRGKLLAVPDRKNLLEALNSDDESSLRLMTSELLEAGLTDPSFANIAADWLQYGRHGLERDPERARTYRKIAVNALIPDAVYDEALFLEGEGEALKVRAFSYYVLGAVLGDADAISALSEYFLYGEIVEEDYFIAGALAKHAKLVKNREMKP